MFSSAHRHRRKDSLIEDYAARMAEAMHVRQASIEARAARVEAAFAIKARSQFLANMHHELRTPLNAIIGFASMLQEAGAFGLGDEKRIEYAAYILQSADLLLGHINTILEAADIQAGELTLHPETSDLAGLAAAAAKRASVAASAAGVAIELRDAGAPVAAEVDVERFSQCIDHLLRVAIKMSPQGSSVLIRAALDGDGEPGIAVRDFGKGYSPEEVRDALDALNAIDGGFETAFRGPGVEYAIARTLVELQGGRIDLRTRPGKGALVTLTAPRPSAIRVGEALTA